MAVHLFQVALVRGLHPVAVRAPDGGVITGMASWSSLFVTLGMEAADVDPEFPISLPLEFP
ncbi:MAG: hypothetical protein RL375_651 [Pseudomonadota bacterium]|jgi:hypothetical protein